MTDRSQSINGCQCVELRAPRSPKSLPPHGAKRCSRLRRLVFHSILSPTSLLPSSAMTHLPSGSSSFSLHSRLSVRLIFRPRFRHRHRHHPPSLLSLSHDIDLPSFSLLSLLALPLAFPSSSLLSLSPSLPPCSPFFPSLLPLSSSRLPPFSPSLLSLSPSRLPPFFPSLLPLSPSRLPPFSPSLLSLSHFRLPPFSPSLLSFSALPSLPPCYPYSHLVSYPSLPPCSPFRLPVFLPSLPPCYPSLLSPGPRASISFLGLSPSPSCSMTSSTVVAITPPVSG